MIPQQDITPAIAGQELAAIESKLAAGAMSARDEAKLLASLKAEDYEACEGSLYRFLLSAWPVIEKGQKFKANWHHHAICDHLEAVTRGEIQKLLINIPPRCTKSTLVSVMWPVWSWINNPTLQFLTGSHNMGLAVRDAIKSRSLIDSDWFQSEWGDRVKYKPDQNQKTRYEFVEGGYRITFGMGSGVTGEGGDVLMIDDPHPAKEGMWSDANRQAVKEAYDYELFNRLNDASKSAIVIIMQRLHEDDLAGHVLSSEEDWVHLRLPMEFEPTEPCETMLGFKDPRSEEKELLHPERFDTGWLKSAKQRLGTMGTAGQLQQRPAPMGGGVVKLAWFKRYQTLPDERDWQEVIQVWDTAQKADELLNCPWVCGTWVVTETGLYLKDVYREWMDYPRGKRMVESLAKRDNPNAIVIEDASTGASLLQELGQDTMLSLIGFQPQGDKVVRMAVETPAIEAGNVYLPHSAPWLPDYEKEMSAFPNATTMDQADMTSMALCHIRTRGGGPEIVDDLFI
jgi:predicted phage terminase large subunit-like protein